MRDTLAQLWGGNSTTPWGSGFEKLFGVISVVVVLAVAVWMAIAAGRKATRRAVGLARGKGAVGRDPVTGMPWGISEANLEGHLGQHLVQVEKNPDVVYYEARGNAPLVFEGVKLGRPRYGFSRRAFVPNRLVDVSFHMYFSDLTEDEIRMQIIIPLQEGLRRRYGSVFTNKDFATADDPNTRASLSFWRNLDLSVDLQFEAIARID